MNQVQHNTENPVTFEQAKQELNMSDYELSAVRSQLGMKGRRPFMLSPIRDFLRDNPSWTTTDVYKRPNAPQSIRIIRDGRRWTVRMGQHPEVMASDRSLPKALAEIAPKIEEMLQSTA